MGVLTDVFAASDAEVQSLTDDDIPAELFPCVEAKWIGPVEYGTLQNILLGTDVQDAIAQQASLVRDTSDDGPWITRVPDLLVDALADMTQGRTRQVAASWSATESFQASGFPVGDLEEVLTDLSQLAKEARMIRKGLFVWTCL